MKLLKRVILSSTIAISTCASINISANANECFIGEIRMFAGNFVPRSWAYLDGQLLPIAQNQALFSILGTTYGGDGRTNFALPDMRGRTPIHQGTGPGLSAIRLGQNVGSETTTLNANNLPSHSHSLNAVKIKDGVANNSEGVNTKKALLYADVDTSETASQITTHSTGTDGQAISNTQPSLGLNHIICLQGLFPSRS